MNPFAPGGVQNFTPEFSLATIEHVLDSQRPQIRLFGSAGGSEHFRSRCVSKLDGGQPHAA